MHKRFSFLATILILAGSSGPLHARSSLNETVLVLPQVAKGELIETVIVFLNTAATTTEVAVLATDARLFDSTQDSEPGEEWYKSFELGPFERREIRTEGGGALITGAVEIRAKNTLSVEGRILRRLIPDGEIISQVAVLAQPPHTELVIPVSYRANGIDNTAIALSVRNWGVLKTHLYDAAGTLITEGELAYGGFPGTPPPHSARFIDEMFAPSLLGNHFTGSLRLEFTAMGLSATALYTHGPELWTGQVQEVKEAKGYYSFGFKPGVDVNIVGQLKVQYGFRVVGTDWGPRWIIECTEEVAQAVDRDPRVEAVY